MQSPRSLDELMVLLADNVTEQISPQDVRDAVVSLYPSRGQLTLTAPVATTFAAVNTYTPLLGTTARDTAVSGSDVIMPVNGCLQFQKAQAQVVLASAMLDVTPSGNNHVFSFAFAKNGTAIPTTAFTTRLNNDPSGITLTALIPIVEGDELRVVVKNVTDTTSITATLYEFFGVGIMV